MNFPETVRMKRFILGLTQEDLGLRIGLSRQSIINLEKGKDVRLATARKIAHELQFSLDSLS